MKKILSKVLCVILTFVCLFSFSIYANNLSYNLQPTSNTQSLPVGVPLDLSGLGISFPEKRVISPTELQGLSVSSVMTGFRSQKNELNIPVDAITYQTKYAGLGGIFLANSPDSVYFTFDCGYEGGVTSKILDTLKEKNVRVVFFVTGQYARENHDLVQRMINEGHIVGNHTWSHPDCPQKNLIEVQDDIFKIHDYVKENFNYEMKLFRYPYGYFSEMLLHFINLQGYTQLFWSYGYRDWVTNDQPDEAKSKKQIVAATAPGMIYLLHAESKTNANILAECIDEIRAKGFKIGDSIDFLKY